MGLKSPLEANGISTEANPFVGRMANRLVRSFADDNDVSVQDRWALVTEVLGFAAEAEQKMTEQQQRIRHLESLTMTDELTGASNRRGLDDFLGRAVANAQRHEEIGVVAFMDLDDFKDLNDRFGHETGDAALKKVAFLLTESTRAGDFVARVGGDEFVVVLTHCNASDGEKRMQQLRNMLEKAKIERNGQTISLKVSVGVVPYDATSRMETLLKVADERMYRDKAKRKAKLAASN